MEIAMACRAGDSSFDWWGPGTLGWNVFNSNASGDT